MTVVVTGAAGFLGHHVCAALLARGDQVLGIDNLNDYYDVSLKEARLKRLQAQAGFAFRRIDIADRAAMTEAVGDGQDIAAIVRLAAQAGVRYSLINPYAYVQANVMGQLVILELCRALPNLRHLVYASSSSVYGGNTNIPFAEAHRVDEPVSLYAATKKTDELMSHVYAHLYRVPATGLRFFTVYGPWGRPDMAAYIFTKAILEGRPIRLFNRGDMRRDFTYIDDLVPAVLAVLDAPPRDDGENAPQRIYNIGNNQPEPLMRFVEVLEAALGRKAEFLHEPMQPGDVRETCADISAIQRDFGFVPKTRIDEGIPKFVDWFRRYHGL